jgi:cytochrome c553
MKRFCFLLLLTVGTAQAAPFASGNAETGKKLFEQKQCSRCHIQMVGGDGSEVFTRPNRKVLKASQLVTQINFCSANAGIDLSAEEEQHLAAYLNQRYYKFP